MAIAVVDFKIQPTEFWMLTPLELELISNRYQYNLKNELTGLRNATLNAIANAFSKNKQEIPLFKEKNNKEELTYEKQCKKVENDRRELFG